MSTSLRLVFVGRGRACVLLRLEHRRDDLLRGRNLRDHRPKAREEQRRDVEGALVEQRKNALRDGFRVCITDVAHRAQLDRLDDLLLIEPAQLLEALAADAQEFDGLALASEAIGVLARKPHDRRIERAAQAALGGADDQRCT